MRIIELNIDGYRKIRCLRFRPGPHGNEIVGRNAQGKSTVLDSIWFALGGKKAEGEQPISLGASSAQVTLDLGSIKVRRTRTETDSYLVVEDIDGNPKRAPQSILDGLGSVLGLDPLAFARSAPKDQVETLLRVFGVQVDDLDQLARETTEARREKTRESKQLRGAAAAIVVNPKLTSISLDVEGLKHQLADARAEVRRLELLVDQAQDCQAEANRAKQKADHEDNANYIEWETEQLTAQLEEIKKAKQIRLDAVGSNVANLSVEEGQVLYEGLPLSQASTARQIRIGLEVATAANPALRLVMIRDGSLLDSDMMSDIHEFAEQHDIQVLIERVGESIGDTYGIVICDGEIESRNEPPQDNLKHRFERQSSYDTAQQAEEVF